MALQAVSSPDMILLITWPGRLSGTGLSRENTSRASAVLSPISNLICSSLEPYDDQYGAILQTGSREGALQVMNYLIEN